MMSLSAAYQQKKNAASQGYNNLAGIQSARKAQNSNIKNTARTRKISSSIQGAVMGAQVGGPVGSAVGGALGLLFG